MSAAFEKVLNFVAELDRRRATHRISVVRPDAIMVEVAVPGERWEVEFFASGEVEVERFRSNGQIGTEDSLVDLWRLLE
jgi:hypothetical protein